MQNTAPNGKPKKTLLITGFEPFGGGTVNASWQSVAALPEVIGDWKLVKLLIPVTFDGAAEAVIRAAESCKPEVILCVGQAGGRGEITPEYVAINVDAARIPDNGGKQPAHGAIVPDGPAAYLATVPVLRMTGAIARAGVPSRTSYHAGTFVCNHVLYALCHAFRGTGVRVGFVHVPYLPEQAKEDVPSMTLEQMEKGLRAAILAL